MTGARLHQLLIEQLVERETASPQLSFLDLLGAMHQFERATQLDQIVTGTECGGMWIDDEGQEIVQVLLHERANLTVGEALSRGIHRKHEAGIALILVVRLGQHDELLRHELLAVVVAHRSGHQQQLPLLDLPLEKWATGPGAFEQTTVVLQHRAEHAQSPSRGQHTRADDSADARHLLPDGGTRQRRNRRGVEIAVRNVIKEVAGGADAEPLQRLGAFGPNALEKLDGRIELELHPLTNRCAYRTGSKSSRSSSVSPVPRKRIGTGTARRSATTLPPFAVPSSLVITRPVSGTAAANASACRTAFCPTVASSTSSDSCGAPACFFPTTRTTFLSSSRSRSSVWSQPAVSTSTVSTPRVVAASTASNATAAGSPRREAPTNGAPRRSAHTLSCSVAPARNVSAAASNTLLPSAWRRFASFATDVVLPVPFTPKIRITVGGAGARASGAAAGPSCSTTMRSRLA